MKVLCAVCEKKFEARRSTAKYCSATCRQRARRRDQSQTTEPEQPGTGAGKRAKRPLVNAVRKDLVKAGRLETVDGQIAMLLAEQTAVATGSAAATLTKTLRAAIDQALDGAPASGRRERAAPEKSELDKARERREQKARQASRRA